jgi:hypothetical protein
MKTITSPTLFSSLFRLAAALLALTLFSGCATKMLLPSEIRMSAVELTTRMEKRFPVERSVAGLIDVTFSSPVVTLSEPRMTTQLDVRVMPLTGKSYTGTVTVSGIPAYDPARRGLLLNDAKVDRIVLDNMSDALSAALARLATQMARATFDDKPFHTFKEEDFTRYGIISYEPLSLDVRKDALVLQIRR